MFYIHQSTCISPQQTFSDIDLENPKEAVENKLMAIEPSYEGIPTSLLRRMGKAVRIGIGAAMPLIKSASKVDGIVIGTANGGMEDCIKFLNQIIQYEEGTLTPTNFVQSTANAIASQVALLSANKGYNITHVHRGLAFENAIVDIAMLIKEYPKNAYLLGGVDEISNYNYNIEYLGGWYKTESMPGQNVYNSNSPGSIAGEGSAMFIVNGIGENARAQVSALHTFHSEDETFLAQELKRFLDTNLKQGEEIDLLLSGENGDSRLLKYYLFCESILGDKIPVARFKHMTGEYETVSALSLWLVCRILEEQTLPKHMLKNKGPENRLKKVLIYNNCKGYQHSLILVSKV